ncbi:hypothetical protein, partial [Pseudomonas syringae]|uniref:hypothetical protein n=1 Tax=Pseudomonas syringae TaxID=317 RepID=UPI00195E44A7
GGGTAPLPRSPPLSQIRRRGQKQTAEIQVNSTATSLAVLSSATNFSSSLTYEVSKHSRAKHTDLFF